MRHPTRPGFGPLAEVFSEHLEQTREHQRLIDERLSAVGGRPARFEGGLMRFSAVNLGTFFGVQPDTPGRAAP